MLAGELHGARADLSEKLVDLGNGERGAGVKRIDVDLVQIELHFDDVVPRESDTRRGEVELRRQMKKDDRERDRQSQFSIDGLVEIRVARIVVVALVAGIT